MNQGKRSAAARSADKRSAVERRSNSATERHFRKTQTKPSHHKPQIHLGEISSSHPCPKPLKATHNPLSTNRIPTEPPLHTPQTRTYQHSLHPRHPLAILLQYYKIRTQYKSGENHAFFYSYCLQLHFLYIYFLPMTQTRARYTVAAGRELPKPALKYFPKNPCPCATAFGGNVSCMSLLVPSSA